jgi:carotenoid cleavage dioxygenase-like enzyme
MFMYSVHVKTGATMSDTVENHYVSGNFAPVRDEIVAFDLPVTGSLPVELNGRYLRNGPNPIGPVDLRTHHWFVGTGMVHGVRLRDGRAEWYRNRYVRGDEVAAAQGLPPLPAPPDVRRRRAQHQRDRSRRRDVGHR